MNLKYAIYGLAALAATSFVAHAEEDSDAPAAADEEKAEAKAKEKDDTKWFFTLPLCRRVQENGFVKKPNSEWEPIEEGRFYPLGSSFKAGENGSITIAFGKECLATVANGASFSTPVQVLGVPSRTLTLAGGEVKLSLPTALKAGLFFVKTPSFTILNPAGDSKYVYTDKGDGFEASVRCVTGTLEVEGRHFKIPAMRAADEFRARCSKDDLETVLYGKSGDYIVKLDRGIVTRSEIQDDGSLKDISEPGVLDWHLSVSTRVQINRAIPEIGKRMSVVMMTFDTIGVMKNHFAFTEGLASVNTGELVIKRGAAEDVAKRAAEVTDEAADVEETPAEESEDKDEDAPADDDDDDDED